MELEKVMEMLDRIEKKIDNWIVRDQKILLPVREGEELLTLLEEWKKEEKS